jgi:hypothetical protein
VKRARRDWLIVQVECTIIACCGLLLLVAGPNGLVFPVLVGGLFIALAVFGWAVNPGPTVRATRERA